MRKLAVCICLLFLAAATVRPARSQDASKTPGASNREEAARQLPEHFYNVNFVLEELDAARKPVNSRSFATTLSTGGSRLGTIVVGSKIPIVTGTPESAKGGSYDTQFQYIDIGVKITTQEVREDGNGLRFTLKVEASSLAAPEVVGGVSEPVIRQNVWDAPVLVPTSKPTVVFNSDDLDNKGSMRLVVTATPIG